MFTVYRNDIPDELFYPKDGEDVSILIGENGSGKSTLLRRLAEYYFLRSNNKVIAIANTIYDKFDIRGVKIEVLKASRGRTLAKRTLKESLRILVNDDGRRFSRVASLLDHVGFSPSIGLAVTGINRDFERIISGASVNDVIKKDLIYIVGQFLSESYRERFIQTVDLYSSGLYDLRNSFLFRIIEHEKLLKSLKVIRDVDVYLSKGGQQFAIANASSGELTMITTFMYITASISDRCVILIDEPENSLHPKWQTEYVRLLMDHFYLYRPKIIIASHSPLIINAAEIFSENISIFRGLHGRFEKIKNEVYNVEELYQSYFGVITPENRYLSQQVVEDMNQLASSEIDLKEYEERLNNMSKSAYSEDQKEVLGDLIKMGRKIQNEK